MIHLSDLSSVGLWLIEAIVTVSVLHDNSCACLLGTEFLWQANLGRDHCILRHAHVIFIYLYVINKKYIYFLPLSLAHR